nr:MAG TPA: replicative helicase [Caudoviricetes sp.]
MGVLLTGSKYYDSTSAIQVIGCILNNPHLLDEDGIYDFRAEDFNNEFHKVIFGSVYNLYNMGAEKLNTKVIEDYLSEKEHSFATYKANHGAEWLHQVYEQADILNFNYYYSRLKKMTLLRAYDNIGLDVSWIYDPDNIIDLEKKQEQSKLLDNTPIEEIADMIDNRVLHIREYLVDGDMDESCQIGDDAEKLLEELKQNPAIGYPLYDKVSSDIAMGARTGKFYLRSATTGVGKAIPNDTLIPTPNGWRKVGDIKVGDYLFAQDSSPTKVLAVFPQPEKKEIWKVTFADGRVAECCGEHLWEYFENGKKKVENTQTIYKRIKRKKTLKSNFSVRVNSPYGNYTFAKSFVNSLLDIESKCISFSRSRKERVAIFDKEFFCLREVALLRGLGMIPQVTHIKNGFYRVSYSENDFGLLEKFLNGEEVIAPTKYLKIVDIKKTSQKTDMTCFTVDNKDHLFLMNDFIVTHNTRNAMADACYMSCSSIYENGEWVDIGEKIPTIFISVELDKSELQTMAWSFVSGVPENHILENKYDFGEYERVVKAIQILKESKLFIEYLPDYNMKDIENCIKRNIRVNKCSCVFLDYITSSMKIIEEITRASGGMKIREDQILFLLSSKLKDIAGKYGVFIYSSTQLNNSFKQEKILDQGMLAGAKSIANRIDYGSIMVDMVPDDYEDLAGLLESHPELGVPNIKLSIYKNRRGKINRVICWQRADKGTSRYKTLFVTDYNLNLIDVYENGKVV